MQATEEKTPDVADEKSQNAQKEYHFLSARSERIVFLVLLSLVAAAPLIFRGAFPAHADWHSHMANMYQFKKAFWQGQLLPRWIDTYLYGYGLPKFNFYAPLLCYLFVVVDFITRDPVISMKATVLLTMFLTTIFGYWYLRKHTGAVATTLATVFIIFSPAVHIYTYNNNFPTSTLALPFIFMVLYGIDAFDKNKDFDLKAFLITSFGYALVVLSHLPTAYMLTLLMVPYFIFSALMYQTRKFIKFFISSFAMGAALTGFYLLPSVMEKKFAHIEVLSKGTGWDFSKNFLFTYLDRLPSDGYYWGIFDHRYYEVSNAIFSLIGLICMVILLSNIDRIKQYFTEKNRIYIAVAMFAISFLMMTPVSYLIWTMIKDMKTLQFPWRFTSFVLPFGVLVFAYTFELVGKIAKEHVSYVGYRIMNYSIVFLLILLIYVNYVNVYRWYWVNDQNLLRAAQIVTWQNREYQPNLTGDPNWEKVDYEQDFSPTLVSTQAEADFTLLRWYPHVREFEVFATADHVVRVRTFNFPGWNVYVDGKQGEIKTDPKDGSILFRVPGGKHEVSLRFESTFIRKAANYLSVLAIAIYFYLIPGYFQAKRKRKDTKEELAASPEGET